MAWMFDITPEGVKLDADTSGSKAFFAAARLLIVLALGWYFYGQPSFRKGDVATPMGADPQLDRGPALRQHERQGGRGRFFGRHDRGAVECARESAATEGGGTHLGVSVQDKGGDIREIGRKLGVRNVVEGSVCRDGPEVRITAQLVRVADGFHIWSETYDRKLESVFALQDEIAKRIGAALKVSLGCDRSGAARAPIDPEAYDEYLKGRELLRQRRDLPVAIEHLKAAVARAPEFAAGWLSALAHLRGEFLVHPHMTPAFATELLAGEGRGRARGRA